MQLNYLYLSGIDNDNSLETVSKIQLET